MTAVVEKASPLEIGRWIEGHRGRYVTSELVWRAANRGFEIDDDDRRALEAYEAGDESIVWDGEDCGVYEWVVDLADNAEVWMNEHVAPEGHSFGWHDCEFFLWTDKEWAENAC